MVPKGHRGVVVCGTRQAERWRDTFFAAGIKAVVVETDVDEGGAYKVAVPERQLIQANAIVTEVLSGKRTLPGPKVGWKTVVALLTILFVVVAMLAR